LTADTAFVLGGGGRWGAVEVGMLQALLDAEIQPDLVLGTSIGAINGAMFAADPSRAGVARLNELWRQASTAEAFGGSVWSRARQVARLRPALIDARPLRRLLTESLPVDQISDLRLAFQCVAASIERAAEHWFTEGDLVSALVASAAVPGLFPPVPINGEHFYDGGLVNSVPLDRAVRLGATRIYVLQVGRLEQPLRAPERIHEAALVAFEIARRHRFATHRDELPDGVELHVLPTGNELAFDDARQLRFSDLGDTAQLIGVAHDATASYLADRA